VGINFLHIAMMMMMMMSEGRRKEGRKEGSMEEGSKEGNMHIPDSAMDDKKEG